MRKYLFYVLVFVVVTVSTGGVVVLTGGGGEKAYTPSDTVQTQPPETDYERGMGALMAGVKQLTGGLPQRVELSLSAGPGGAAAVKAELSALLALDTENLERSRVNLSGEISYLGLRERIDLTYIEQTIYLSCRAAKVRLAVNDLTDILAVLGEYTSLNLGAALGSLDGVGLDTLLGDITFAEEEGEQKLVTVGLDLSALNLGSPAVEIRLDGENSFQSARVTGLMLPNGWPVAVEARFSPGEADVANPNPEEYADLGFTPKLVRGILKTASLKQFDLSGRVNLRGAVEQEIRLNRLLVEGGSVFASVQAAGAVNATADVQYQNDTVYLSAFGKKVKAETSVIRELAGLLGDRLGGFSLFAFDLSGLDLDAILGYLDRVDSLTWESAGKDTVVTLVLGEGMIPGTSGKITLRLTVNGEGYLSGLRVFGLEIDGLAVEAELSLNNIGGAVELPVPDEEEYLDLFFLPALAEGIANTASQSGWSLSGRVSVGGAAEFAAQIEELSLDLSGGVNALGRFRLTEPAGLALSLQYYGGAVYAEALGQKLRLDTDTLFALLGLFGVAVPEVNLPQLGEPDIEGLLSHLESVSCQKLADGLTLSVRAMGLDAALSVRGGYLSSVSVRGAVSGYEINVDLSLNNPGQEVRLAAPSESEYTDLAALPELVKAVWNTVSLNGFRLAGQVNLGGALNLNLDLSELAIDLRQGLKLSASASLSGLMDLSARLRYADGTVYADVFGKRVLLRTETIAALLDLFGVALPDLGGVQLNAALLQKYLALLEGIDLAEEGGRILLTLRAAGAEMLLTAENGYISSLCLSGLEWSGVRADAQLRLLQPGEPVSVPVPDAAQYIDLGFAPALVSGALNTAGLRDFHLTGNVQVGELSVSVRELLVNLADGVRAKGSVSLAGPFAADADATYAGDTVYLEALGKKLRLDTGTIAKLLEVFGITVPDASEMLGNVSFDAETVAGLLAHIDSVTYEQSSGATLVRISLTGGARLELTVAAGYLAGVSVAGVEVGASAISAQLTLYRIGQPAVITRPADADYIDLGFAPALAEGLLNTLKLTNFDLSGEVAVSGGLDLRVTLERLLVDISDGFKGNGEFSLLAGTFGLDAGIIYRGDTAYLSAFGKKLSVRVRTVLELLDTFGVTMPDLGALGSVKLDAALISDILALVRNITYGEADGRTTVILELSNGGVVRLCVADGYFSELGLDRLALAGTVVDATLRLNNPGQTATLAEPDAAQYVDLGFAPALVAGALNTAGLRDFHLTGNVQVGELSVSVRELLVNLADGVRAKGSVSLAGPFAADADATYAGDTVYLEALGKKLRLDTGTIAKLLEVFGIAVPDLSEMLGNVSFDAETVAGLLAHIDSVTYEQSSGATLVRITLTGGARLELTVAAGFLAGVSVAGLEVGASAISAQLTLYRIGQPAVISRPADADYIDLGFAPALVRGIQSTLLGRDTFRLSAVVDVREGKAFPGTGIKASVNDFCVDLTGGLKDIRLSGALDITGAFAVSGGLAYSGGRLFVDYQGFRASLADTVLDELLARFNIGFSLNGLKDDALGELGKLGTMDAAELAEYLGCIKDIVYGTENGVTGIRVLADASKWGAGDDIVAELTVDAQGRLARITGANIVSAVDGSRVDFSVEFADGEGAVAQPEESRYVDFDILPEFLSAFESTAALNSFGLESSFRVLRGDGTALNADPKLTIELGENRGISKVSGSAVIDALAMKLGFWYRDNMIYANVNDMKLKLSLNSVSTILQSVMGLVGGGVGDIMETLNAIIDKFRLNELGDIILAMDIARGEGGAKTIGAVLNSRLLYGNEAIPEAEFVTVRLEIAPTGYFSRLEVKNVFSGSDRFDFTVLLTNILQDGTAVNVQAEDPPAEEFIDISAVSGIIDALTVTGQYKYFKITGNIETTLISIKREVDIRVRVREDGGFEFAAMLSSTGGSKNALWDTRMRYENTLYFDGTDFYMQRADITVKNGSVNVRTHYKIPQQKFFADPIPYIKDWVDDWKLSLALNIGLNLGGDTQPDYYKILKSMQISESGTDTKVSAQLSGSALLPDASVLSDFKVSFEINGERKFTKLYIEDLELINIVKVKANLELTELAMASDTVLDFRVPVEQFQPI